MQFSTWFVSKVCIFHHTDIPSKSFCSQIINIIYQSVKNREELFTSTANYNFKQKKPVDIYCSNRVFEALKREYIYVFDPKFKYPGIPQINQILIDKNRTIQIGNATIQPVEVMHYKLPVLGFRINNFAYITDAKTISDEEKEKIKNLDVLIINALRKEEHISQSPSKEDI